MLKNNLKIVGSKEKFESWKNKYILNIILLCMWLYGKKVGIYVVFIVLIRCVINLMVVVCIVVNVVGNVI